MSGVRWERWAAASGIVYAVLVVVGLFLLVFEEIDRDSDEEILSYFADGGNRAVQIAGFALVAVGVLFFLLFVSTLWNRLRSVEPEPTSLSALAFGAGVMAAALQLGAAALLAATSTAAEVASRFVVDPNLARFAVGTGFLFLLAAVVVSGVLVIATSVLALRNAVLPNWLGWVGFAAVVLAVVEAFLLPVFVIPVWVLVVSGVLIVRTPTSLAEERGRD
jgi:hypothetical protein